MRLGGRRYSEFEIEQGAPIVPLVYGDRDEANRRLESIATHPGERRTWESRAGL